MTDKKEPKILKVGDSRTVGMYFARHPREEYRTTVKDDGYYAKVGEGVRWLGENQTAITKQAENADVIVVSMGVNDIDNYKEYAKKMQELANGPWKGKQVYFTAVNPVGPGYKGYQKYNKRIDAFNLYMQKNLPDNVHYIDTNTYFKQNNCQFSRDGLHYTNSTNKKIDGFITAEVNKNYTAMVMMKDAENAQELVDYQEGKSLQPDKSKEEDKTVGDNNLAMVTIRQGRNGR